jgi:hypothetical protein
MKINLYNDGSYTVDHGWKAASFPPAAKSYAYYFPDSTNQYHIGYNSEDVGREAEDARRIPFIWKTDNGRLYLVEDMATPHLINAINMIWGNVLGTRNERSYIKNWDSLYIDRAIKEFSKELLTRVREA